MPFKDDYHQYFSGRPVCPLALVYLCNIIILVCSIAGELAEAKFIYNVL